MRPRIQGSATQEEDEHPYELLLTAETKKLVSVDGKAKGTPHLTPTPSMAAPVPKEFYKFVILGGRGRPCHFVIAWVGAVGFCGSLGWWAQHSFSFSTPELHIPVGFDTFCTCSKRRLGCPSGTGKEGAHQHHGRGGSGASVLNPHGHAVQNTPSKSVPLGSG